MADLQLLIQQLAQGQIDLQNHIAALANTQAAPVVAARKKVVTNPGTYNGSPAKFHKWWSKIKIWMQVAGGNRCRGRCGCLLLAHWPESWALGSGLPGPLYGSGPRTRSSPSRAQPPSSLTHVGGSYGRNRGVLPPQK